MLGSFKVEIAGVPVPVAKRRSRVLTDEGRSALTPLNNETKGNDAQDIVNGHGSAGNISVRSNAGAGVGRKAPGLSRGNARSDRTVFQKDVRKTIPATVEALRPILRAAPKDGVTVLRDQAYGDDPRQILDVYRPTARTGGRS
jgi:hypothetical protein